MLHRIFITILATFSIVTAYGQNQNNSFLEDVHVLLIGFDGWGSYSMEKAEMPVLKKLMTEGSWTLKKRSVLPSSSAANWASMFMGASPEIHGYTKWDSKKPEIPPTYIGEHKMFPTISQILHKQRKGTEIGVFCNWSVIKYLVDSQAVDRLVHFPVKKLQDKYSGMTNLVNDYIIKKKPSLCTIVYDFPDHYGHADGFDSAEYFQSLNDLDKCLKSIIDATKEAGIYDKTVFIVTSDHGGIKKTHGGITLNELETPFIIFGLNIKKGHNIQEFMMQYDIAATIAYIFGLETPQAWIGRPVLSVFKNVRNN